MLIISGAYHYKKDGVLFGFGPYVREMNLWIKDQDEIIIIGELRPELPTGMDIAFIHQEKIRLVPYTNFRFTSPLFAIKSLFIVFPYLAFQLLKEMYNAKHIHIRCPATIGILACVIQIFFPWKKKTGKYAGNWDFHFPAPFSYRIQRWILNNTFLTRNIQVLVYGSWPFSSRNIKSFYTATYFEKEIQPVNKQWSNTAPVFIYSGVVELRKCPIETYEIFKEVLKWAPDAQIIFCGGGSLLPQLHQMAQADGLIKQVFFAGSVQKETLVQYYLKAHFLLFFTRTSEGWPKAVAESMFWGVLPVTKPISVVAQMLDNGRRGILLESFDAASIAEAIRIKWQQPELCEEMSNAAMNWSRQYTLNKFELDISKLL